MFLLDRFENKYIIKGYLIAETPIHIGVGDNDFSPNAVDDRVIRDENNNPFIPGTSIKGVLRTFIERLINAGIFENMNEYVEKEKGNKIWACDILNNPCISDDIYKEIKKKCENKDKREFAKEIYCEQCDVCKLFGGLHFASKIQISDAKLVDDKANTSIRDGVAIDRDSLTAANASKYTYECINPGAKFKFEMTIDNLDENHKEIVQFLISFLSSGDMKIGGKTSAGLGSIKLVDEKIYLIDDINGLKEYYLNGLSDKHLKQEVFKVV